MCFHMGTSIHHQQLQAHGSSNPRSVRPDGHPPYDKLGLGGSIIVLLHGYRDSDELHPILANCVLSELSLQKKATQSHATSLGSISGNPSTGRSIQENVCMDMFYEVFKEQFADCSGIFCFSIMSDAGDMRRPRLHPVWTCCDDLVRSGMNLLWRPCLLCYEPVVMTTSALVWSCCDNPIYVTVLSITSCGSILPMVILYSSK